MYTFEHGITEQTPALTDYRYIGSNPNNYGKFNDGETWRIIGVFKVEDGNGKWEDKVKIIRDESSDELFWNLTWFGEWNGSTMQVYLNDNYIIDSSSFNMISVAKFYLGGLSTYPSGDDYYNNERSLTVYGNMSKYWIGKIVLMYPSDYIFSYVLGVDDTCYNTPNNCSTSIQTTSWLFRSGYNQCFLTPNIFRNNTIFM